MDTGSLSRRLPIELPRWFLDMLLANGINFTYWLIDRQIKRDRSMVFYCQPAVAQYEAPTNFLLYPGRWNLKILGQLQYVGLIRNDHPYACM